MEPEIAADNPSDRSRTNALWEVVFSTKVRVAALFVSSLCAVVAIIGFTAPSVQETWTARALAVIAVAATVMLWLRNRYAVHAGAFLFATAGVGAALLGDPGHHSLLHWTLRFGTAAFLFWLAYLLLKLGKRLTDRRV